MDAIRLYPKGSRLTERVPTATYRLQFHKAFTFRDALGLVDYLAELGISDLYASPITAARPGSLHGYDVIDPTRLNPELGTAEDFTALSDALLARGMGLILDVVPNHMCATDPGNRWWQDVLEQGQRSPYAKYFDIDFHPAKVDLHDKILLPILGDQFGKVLENQEIQVRYEDGGFTARYGEQRLPLVLQSWPRILEPALERVGANSPDHRLLDDVLLRIHDPRADYAERKGAVAERLKALIDNGNGARAAIEESLASLNGRKGDPKSFDRLETLLLEQPYRVSFWRVASDEVNYRRFFDINDLVAIRVEVPEVFRATHEQLLGFVREGRLTGLRIDHVDGLLQPVQYLESLRKLTREAGAGSSFLIQVEKILDQDERLDPTWPVDGTTGYEFMNVLNGVFVEPAGLKTVEAFYERFTRRFETPEELIYRSKRLTLATSMAGELHVLALRLDRISEQHRWSRDFTLKSLEGALAEVIACFPVYRTYVDGTGPVKPYDRSIIEAALSTARGRNAATNESIFSFIAEVLLLEDPEGITDEQKAERVAFLLRFQQLTGPVMAKGLEDTAGYRRYPLSSMCEVGGGPDRAPSTLEEFHEFNASRQKRWPKSLSATTTHDTKRAEDARARLNVLSEVPDQWTAAVDEWARLNAPKKVRLGTHMAPDSNEEYLIYQTLVATFPDRAHPDYPRRLEAYLTKALREARFHSSWLSPNAQYEGAVVQFAKSILDPGHEFAGPFERWLSRLELPMLWNALGQTLLKITCPGLPDFYQGSEFIDLRLTDPDNRQPVDFAARRRALSKLPDSPLTPELLSQGDHDQIKLHLTRLVLHARRRNADLFLRGDYVPLELEGPSRRRVVAFARRDSDREMVVLVGRFHFAGEGNVWSGTTVKGLTGPGYQDLLTGAVWEGSSVDLADVFSTLPLALLERSGSRP